MNVAVFVYNWPHRKTQDFLFRLFVEKAEVALVLAADPVKLHIPASVLRLKPKYGALVHPRRICERLGWRYEVVEHNSNAAARLLRSNHIDVAIIAGARILKNPVVSAPTKGIVNFHPGLIPEVRGLDALQWAIYEDKPLGVTAHIIDERVDAGRIIMRQEISLQPDDDVRDVSMRLQDTQTDMLPRVLEVLSQTDVSELPLVGKSELHRKMPSDLELKIPALLEQKLIALKMETV